MRRPKQQIGLGMSILEQESMYIAISTLHSLSKDDNLDIFQDPDFKEDDSFMKAVQKIKKSCLVLKREKNTELEIYVSKVDLGANFHPMYKAVTQHLTRELTYGRIIMVILFHYYLCKKLYWEGRGNEVSKVADMLTEVLTYQVTPYLVQNHRSDWARLASSEETTGAHVLVAIIMGLTFCAIGRLML